MSSRERDWHLATQAGVKALDRTNDGSEESEVILALYEALMCAQFFMQKHSMDDGVTKVFQHTGPAINNYLKSRMKAPGVKGKIETYKRRLQIDNERLIIVNELIDAGLSSNKAYAKAGEILHLHGHPAGQTESGDAPDSTTIQKSCERANRANILEKYWELPGQDRAELPRIEPYI